MNKYPISNVVELAKLNDANLYSDAVICSRLYGDSSLNPEKTIYLNSFLQLLVLKGEATIFVNNEKYAIAPNDLLLLLPMHLLRVEALSHDFECMYLVADKKLAFNMTSSESLYLFLVHSRLPEKPVISLDIADAMRIYSSTNSIHLRVMDRQHTYHNELVYCLLGALYFDLMHILKSYMVQLPQQEAPQHRHKVIILNLLELLVENFKTEHGVDFYARQLCMTPQNLNLITKKMLNITVSKLIYELLYGESRKLLRYSDKTIQQIADELHFSDQAAFGKFFRRKSGKSPMEFRKAG